MVAFPLNPGLYVKLERRLGRSRLQNGWLKVWRVLALSVFRDDILGGLQLCRAAHHFFNAVAC